MNRSTAGVQNSLYGNTNFEGYEWAPSEPLEISPTKSELQNDI